MNISALEKQIDEMVYALYGPAYRTGGSRRRRLRFWKEEVLNSYNLSNYKGKTGKCEI
jgi:hypothetical protein